jgi:hypothetical protein
VILSGVGGVLANGVTGRQSQTDGRARLCSGLGELIAVLAIDVREERAFLVKDARGLARDDRVGQKIVADGCKYLL